MVIKVLQPYAVYHHVREKFVDGGEFQLHCFALVFGHRHEQRYPFVGFRIIRNAESAQSLFFAVAYNRYFYFIGVGFALSACYAVGGESECRIFGSAQVNFT